MPTSSFRDLEKVCKALGLQEEQCKKGIMYKGQIGGKWCRIMIHQHAAGRDIPTGTFNRYVKDLKFKNKDEFFEYLRNI